MFTPALSYREPTNWWNLGGLIAGVIAAVIVTFLVAVGVPFSNADHLTTSPITSCTYVVQKGDTPEGVANRFVAGHPGADQGEVFDFILMQSRFVQNGLARDAVIDPSQQLQLCPNQ